ncbi:hypothetical protein C0J52_11061 [Blattella germanica]|nr:hypothetical protein C0J52_11061 [Blattella germanica]
MNVQRHHLSHDDMFRAIGIIENGGTQADAARVLNTGKGNVENVTVTTQTVRNRLHERGLNAHRPLRCPAIRYGNRAPRVLWCRQHEDWTDNQWGQVLFTDESRFSLRPDSRRLRIWRQPGAAERLRYVQEVHKFQGGSIMTINLFHFTMSLLNSKLIRGLKFTKQFGYPIPVNTDAIKCKLASDWIKTMGCIQHDSSTPVKAFLETDLKTNMRSSQISNDAVNGRYNPAWTRDKIKTGSN